WCRALAGIQAGGRQRLATAARGSVAGVDRFLAGFIDHGEGARATADPLHLVEAGAALETGAFEDMAVRGFLVEADADGGVVLMIADTDKRVVDELGIAANTVSITQANMAEVGDDGVVLKQHRHL